MPALVDDLSEKSRRDLDGDAAAGKQVREEDVDARWAGGRPPARLVVSPHEWHVEAHDVLDGSKVVRREGQVGARVHLVEEHLTDAGRSGGGRGRGATVGRVAR